MKAVLDHIGIAVQDIEAALAFYRDALGVPVDLAHAGHNEQLGLVGVLDRRRAV